MWRSICIRQNVLSSYSELTETSVYSPRRNSLSKATIRSLRIQNFRPAQDVHRRLPAIRRSVQTRMDVVVRPGELTHWSFHTGRVSRIISSPFKFASGCSTNSVGIRRRPGVGLASPRLVRYRYMEYGSTDQIDRMSPCFIVRLIMHMWASGLNGIEPSSINMTFKPQNLNLSIVWWLTWVKAGSLPRPTEETRKINM